MPDGPEIKLNADTRAANSSVNELTGSFDRLSKGVQGADNELEAMQNQLKELAGTLGVVESVWKTFSEGIEERAKRGKITIRELREELIEIQKGDAFKAYKQDGGDEDIRSLRKTIDLYEELNRQVRAYIESANVAAASGKLTNLPQFEARAENIYSRYPLSSEHVGSINSSLGNLSSANSEIEMERQLAQMEREHAQEQKQGIQQLAQLERDRDEQRIQRDREYSQMERERAQQEQQALRENAQMEREIAENRANEIRAQSQQIENRLRLERELVALEDRAALAGKRGSARVEVLRGQALRGEEDPARRSRIGAAFDTMAEAEEGGGGFSARMMRGVAQGAMGVGAGNYQMYYLMNSISNIGSGSAAAAGIAAGGVGLLALAAAQVAAANAASQHARELRNMSMELGTTARNARELENVAKVTGIPMDSVVSGMRQLTMGIEESGGRGRGNAAVLRGMGISALTDTGGLKDTKQLLFEISDVIRGMDNLQARDVLERLFGRGGRQLLPMLKQDLRGSVDALGELNSALDDRKLEDYAQAMSKLGLQWEGLVATFAKPVVASIQFVTDTASGTMKILEWLMGGEYSTSQSRADYANRNKPNLMPNSPLQSQSQLDSQKRDLQAGEAYRGIKMRGMEHTPAGIADALKDAESDYAEAQRVFKASGERGLTPSIAQANAVTSAGARVETIKAEQKAMTEIPAERLRLQKELNAEQEKELFGHAKIHQAMLDELAIEKDKLPGKVLPADLEGLIRGRYAARDANYDTQLGIAQNRSDASFARSGVTSRFSLNRAGNAAQFAVNRAARMGGGGYGDINDDYNYAMGNAYSAYSESMSGIAGAQSDLDNEPDENKRIGMRSSIAGARRGAQQQFAKDSVEALRQSLVSTLDVTKQLTEEQRSYNSAIGELRTKGDESVTTLRQGLIRRSMSDSMQLTRARMRGQGAGGQGALANNEFGYSMGMANLGIHDAISGAHESMINESMRSSDAMASAITPQDRSAEEIKHARDVFEIRQRLQTELGTQMEAIDQAHIQLQMTSIEIQQQQNEQVKAFAGDLIGAYMQAMLHRQSGSFPVREALGQQFLGWGKKVGENIVGAGFGMLQGSGVGQHDIIPGLAHQVSNDVDPATGQPRVVNGSATHEGLTTLGKIFQGTPLGHRPQANDKYVMSIDTTTQKILALMQNVYGQDGNGGGSMPGLGQGDYDVSGGSPLPLGLPLSSGSESGAIINSIVSGGKSGGGGIGGMLNGITGGVFGKLFSSGPSNIPLSWNSPLGSGSENGSIINSIPGSDGSGGVTMSVDSEGNPVYSINANSSASGSSGRNGQFGTINTGTAGSTIEGVANTATTAIKDVSAVANAASNIKNSDKNTGKSGAGAVSYDISQGLQAAATVANSIPGGQVVGSALEIGALVAAGVSAIFGDQRKDRALQMQYDAEQHQWTAPSAYGLVTSQNGMSVTGDLTGAPRQYNGPLLAYPNTSSYTSAYDYTVNRVGPQIAPPSGVTWPGGGGMSVPGGVGTLGNTILSLYIQAMDNKSIMDNAAGIASAVHAAINDGHPIRNGIQAAANPR